MDKIFTKRLFLSVIFALFILSSALGQTITIGNVDPGPYGQGSTISVPININDAAGCIAQNNTFNLYLSDASGNFVAGGTLIGSYTGFYVPFLNGKIPNGTPAGAGYKVMVVSTAPPVSSAPSAAFTINNTTGVTAGAVSQAINASFPEVFGQCIGIPNTPFTFTNNSDPNTTVTASFYNELSQALEASNVAIPNAGYTFTANAANYTVTVKAVNAGGIVGTYSYQLINNLINTSIGSTGTPFVCLVNGRGDLTFNVDISSALGIQVNYPGNTYLLTWGDGTTTTYTLCQIRALGGKVTHTFNLPSCGNIANGHVNSFEIDFQPQSAICGPIGAAPSNYAKVLITPITHFDAPLIACAGTAITIPNTSNPGPDPNSTVNTCANNPNALYTWYLDGVIVAQNVPLSKPLILPANTPKGTHTILLHSQVSGGGCVSPDYSQTICLEDPPQPAFTIPGATCITNGPIIPNNTSVTDNTCSVAQYTWTVTGPAAVSYAGGTNANSFTPQFVFTAPGTYHIQLAITSAGCGVFTASSQIIIVDSAPVVSLSPDATICGNNLTLTFDPNQTITKTVLSGTTQPQANTYTWTITGGAYSFLNGTNANSQYPKILFADFATYTIQVTQQNSCGTASGTQVLTFVQAPVVVAGNDQNVCASNPAAQLSGTITGTYTSYQWVGGTGTFSAGRNSLITTYTPSAAEINAGQVTLTLQVKTSLPAPCNIVTDNLKIIITPTAVITSPPTGQVCSGQPFTYTITANHPTATFAWTASVTSGVVTGFTAAGNGNTINDILTNTGTTDATVTYVITPTIGSCPGTPFNLVVTVHPLPIATATAVNSPICSNQPANITLASNVANTTYTWTSVASANITGNSTQAAPIAASGIQDILNNNGSTSGTVTYTITPYNGTCPGTPVVVVITVDPSTIQANAGPNDEICGTTTTYTLQGNVPSRGTGLWTIIQGAAGATFSDNTNPNAVVSGLIPGNTYQFQWTITGSATCPTTSSIVSIIVDKPPVGGTTSSPAIVCSGSNVGQITLAGQFGSVIRWESSIDNGTTWQPINNTSTTLSYINLTQTTQYRAILHNGNVCADVPSTATIITVNPQTVQANAGANDEICGVTTYTLQGNNPAPGTGKWTIVQGPAGATFSDDTNPNAVVSGLQAGNTYQFQWTITGAASCPPTTSTVNIIVDKAPIGGTTSSDASVCSGNNAGQITLAGQLGTVVRWESSVDNGATWQPVANTSTTLSYANLTQTTQYRAIVHNSNICADVPSTVTTITVNPQTVQANAGPNDEICGTTTIYTLQGNNPAHGTGKWTIVQGPAGATFSDDTKPNAVVSGLVPGSVYQFQWTITGAASCPPTTSVVSITVDKPPFGGTTSSPATVCSGGNNGQITLTGYFGSIVRWESSIDNGASWQPITNVTTSLTYNNLTQTTRYRAILHSGNVCADVPSSVTTITVNPVTPQADAGKNYDICNQTVITLVGNNPAPFNGVWTQVSGPAVNIANPNNYQTQVTGLSRGNVYVFKWTIKGLPPCSDTESSITIGAFADVIPSFTMDQNHGCGPTTVTFTNKSTPTPTGTFQWNFGDGSPLYIGVNPPTHSFAPSPDGKEITYTVTLTPTSNCNSQVPYIGYVKVSPQNPVAIIQPNQTSACGAFTLIVKNLAPGDNADYDFYLKDNLGNIIEHLHYTDKRNAVFQKINPTQSVDYTVYLTVTDKCGNQNSSIPIIISLAPSTIVSQVQIKGGVSDICLGSSVTFQNISTGGNRFTLTVYNAQKKAVFTIADGATDLNYTPTATGTYYVSIIAGNDGCGDAPESALRQFRVFPDPNPSFTYTTDSYYNVTFTNTTPNAGDIPATSLNYNWDFGDGSPIETSHTPNNHKFSLARTFYTITLKATTPGSNCFAVATKTLTIKFSGNLFLPNALIPSSHDKQLNTFIAKGYGFKKWHMQIFNNFGQLVWETTKLDSNGSPVDGWDGTYKGQPAQQGVYIWQISGTLLNGEDWKGMVYNGAPPTKVGPIHLIR